MSQETMEYMGGCDCGSIRFGRVIVITLSQLSVHKLSLENYIRELATKDYDILLHQRSDDREKTRNFRLLLPSTFLQYSRILNACMFLDVHIHSID